MESRRQFLGRMGTAALAAAVPGALRAQTAADATLRIAPCTVPLGPRQTLTTVGYNGSSPGPLLRMRQGKKFVVDVVNGSANPETVHFHGLFLPPEIDGAMEEGTPMIAPGAHVRYEFTPQPAGFRWYHTHSFAGNDLSRAQYSGQHGPLYVEPAENAGRYDAEAFLSLEDWKGRMMGSGDGSLMPSYDVSTINGRMLGSADPIRVKQGGRLLLHIVNASPTDTHWIALAGHALQVVALDGNDVPMPRAVGMLRLAPAERVSAVVTLDQPGVWVLGEVRTHIREAGMGLVVEYAGSTGKPAWQQPPELVWDYAQFGDTRVRKEAGPPPQEIPLVFQSKFRGHGAPERWTINGKSYPDVASPRLVAGRRYRLRLDNRSADDHPIHLHRHSFQLAQLPGLANTPGGIVKDTVLVPAGTSLSVDFTANNPGATLLHCHQQDHMDRGFMMVFQYA